MVVKGSQSEYHRRHYAKHRDEVIRKARERRQVVQSRLAVEKSRRACERCGFSHPAALDFHHRDPSRKSFAIATGPALGKSWETIVEEIAKCEVLCANCHRIEHASEVLVGTLRASNPA
jgi:hypothetical protein